MIANDVVIDALPALDRDLDDELVKAKVMGLIGKELKTMETKDYLQNIPTLKTTAELDEVMRRVEKMAQVYHKGPLTFAPPDAVLENDVQAWRKAMATANIVLTQQEDHLFHLEDQLASPDLSADFLARNADLEAGVGFYRQKLQEVSRAAHEVQKTRQALAVKASQQLDKLTIKRNESIQQIHGCERAYAELMKKLKARGVDYAEEMRRREENAMDEFDPRLNSTVRQYEEVHSSEMADEQEDKVEEVVEVTKVVEAPVEVALEDPPAPPSPEAVEASPAAGEIKKKRGRPPKVKRGGEQKTENEEEATPSKQVAKKAKR